MTQQSPIYLYSPSHQHTLRKDIIRNALIQQLKQCEDTLKTAKAAVEEALAQDTDLITPTDMLNQANTQFKDEIKHANMHLPKAKAKAKAKAVEQTPA